jgi:hypothetical protein
MFREPPCAFPVGPPSSIKREMQMLSGALKITLAVATWGVLATTSGAARPTGPGTSLSDATLREAADHADAAAQSTIRRVTPAGGLQGVLDPASPGDVILLAPGTYAGLITLTKGGDSQSPVVVRAEDPGTVTLTNATPPGFKLRFANVQNDLYRALVPWRVRWVMVEGHRNLMDYSTVRLSSRCHNSARISDASPGWSFARSRSE